MNNEISVVQKELEKEILTKIKIIEENILTGKGTNGLIKIEMLAMINDELSDVLLNWDDRIIDNQLGDSLM